MGSADERTTLVTTENEGYARLPEDLLRDLLRNADEVADSVLAILGPALDGREEMRGALDSLGLVRTPAEAKPVTVCGVDGGYAVERTAALDLALSVAVGVEGLSSTTTTWESNQYRWWTRADKHQPDTERLARGVMVAQELAILRDAPHDLRILDGSHLTLVIQLNTALSSFTDSLRRAAADEWQKLDTAKALGIATTSHGIIAMPKYDSSRQLTDRIQEELGREIPGDDKHLMSLLLEPGQQTVPLQVPNDPWAKLHFSPGGTDVARLAQEFDEAVIPLRDRAVEFWYFKPDEFTPAFRIETKRKTPISTINTVCASIASQITGPFVREPYPQYLADMMAKSVGLGLSALHSAAQLRVSSLGNPDIARMLTHSYRTGGI